MFAYLALNRARAIGRDELAGALWPECAPRSQDGALRTLLSRLRTGLGEGVLKGRVELTLELPEPVWIDIEAATTEMQRAQDALARGDARGAWALAQVPLNIASRGLLPGGQLAWLESARRELSDIRLEALEVIGRAGLRLGSTQLSSVERSARTLIDSEPYRESGYVLLMSALEAQGNVAEGLRVYEQLRSLLREELGTAPSPESAEVYERLLHPDRRTVAGGGPRPAPAARRELGAIAMPPELDGTIGSDLVGRRDELSALERWLRSTDSERVMLLSGEPGVGKTRLLVETARRAHAAGAIVLAGRSPEETLVPYQPFLEALRHYVFSAPVEDLRAVASKHGSELGRLIPELPRRVPELPPADGGDPETERYRLFEAVAGLLGELSATTPLLLVLDDLHWADRPTLLLLRHLARSPQSRRVMILGAFRAGLQRSESRGFDTELVSLRHDRLIAQLDISGLPEREAMELVRRCAGGTPSLAFLRALYAETEGNPFFIEEIVRHLLDLGIRSQEAGTAELEGVGLPDDVRDVISSRLARLGDDTFEWLRVAAVIGRDFDGGLLERVLEFGEERFLAALEDALAAGLVIESPSEPGGYSFSHALVRETLYGGMASRRRATIHRRVGVVLEQSGAAEQQVGALAHHFTRARRPRTPSGRSTTRYARGSGRARCSPTKRRPTTMPARSKCSISTTRASCGAGATCCSSSARLGCEAASGSSGGRRSTRPRRWRRRWATARASPARRSAPRGGTSSLPGSSTRN